MPESDAPKESVKPCNPVFHVRTGEPLARMRFAVYDKHTDELLALFFKHSNVTNYMLSLLLEHQRETYYKEL